METAVTSGAKATLLAEAAAAHPLEACGLLLGAAGLITAVVPVRNVHPDPARHFELDPAALIAAFRAERTGGPQVFGYYHSHPTGSTSPSATDQASASGDGRIWAIVAAGTIGWWRDAPGGFEPLPLRLVAG